MGFSKDLNLNQAKEFKICLLGSQWLSEPGIRTLLNAERKAGQKEWRWKAMRNSVDEGMEECTRNPRQRKFRELTSSKHMRTLQESSSEICASTFDRLQKLISQLEIQGEVITQEDMNLKLLRSLPSEWKTHALIWRNKEEIETISFYSSNSSYLHGEDLEQIDPDDLEEIDFTNERKNGIAEQLGARSFHQKAEESFFELGEISGRENSRRTVTVETPTENALVAQDGIGGYDWSYQAKEEHYYKLCIDGTISSGKLFQFDFEGLDLVLKSCVKAYATLKIQISIVYSSDNKSLNLICLNLTTVRKEHALDVQSLRIGILDDDSEVLLRVPRKDNIYSVDLKSVVPTKGLTCLFAKATINDSNLWHRRLGHINFKNMNKIVRGNLVRGLPSNIFENDHSCVACQKGKKSSKPPVKANYTM
ncbi:putative ribonuclease H-like domain-containing protein [Tanacetum coccineum]